MLKERTSILNAYYLPYGGDKTLYDSITPVNTFKIIFNTYFNTNLELVKDSIFHSTYEQPYKFTYINDRLD